MWELTAALIVMVVFPLLALGVAAWIALSLVKVMLELTAAACGRLADALDRHASRRHPSPAPPRSR